MNENEFNKYVMNTYKRYPISFEHGEGAYLFDDKGNKYLDFVSGIAVNALGYKNKNFIDSITKQLNKINHSSNLFYVEPQGVLAKKISEISGLDKLFFCNSGAEANEASIKLARKYALLNKKGNKIVAMKNSFHGRTLGSLTLTGQEKYRNKFLPLVPNVEYIEFNDINALENIMDNDVCAVITECIQGEGGIIQMDKEFYDAIRKSCNQYNALFIVDEVQTGMGRTGEFFAYQNYAKNYEEFPDIISMAKALGNGIPIGAVAAKDFCSCFEPSDHASTFGGNFIASVAGISVIDEIINNNLLSNVKETGKYLSDKLKTIKNVKKVKGMGLILGLEVDFPPTDIIKKAQDKGLLILSAGSNTIRLLPPLIITKKEADIAYNILNEILK